MNHSFSQVFTLFYDFGVVLGVHSDEQVFVLLELGDSVKQIRLLLLLSVS